MTQSDLEVLRDLLVAGKVTPVIDRCYDLSDVSEAFRYFEERHAKGKIVVSGIARGRGGGKRLVGDSQDDVADLLLRVNISMGLDHILERIGAFDHYAIA